MTSAIRFHARLASISNAPSEFRLLNGFPPMSFGLGSGDIEHHNTHTFMKWLDQDPRGKSPFCKHILSIIESIKEVEEELIENDQKAVIVILTDGDSATDGELTEVMKPLEDLPVWLVVRLCTDDQKVVRFWNELDK